jgi:hypothetical protein
MADPHTNDCACPVCAQACEFKPGWFEPHQLAPLAKAMGLTIEQLFADHLAVDWWAGDDITGGRNIFVLSPRLMEESGGGMFPANPHGCCHWYRKGKCEIHSQGKPAECAFAHHNVSHAEYLHHRIGVVRAWALCQETIYKLLGREPTLPNVK